MPPLIKAVDKTELINTSEYPYANWKFEKFNCVQSSMMDFYDKEVNGLIAASTSSGKTVVAEQFLSYEIRKRGGKGMYLVPMRALAQEKIDQWTDPNYHFKDLNVSICTGDYRITKDRTKELNESNLIIMTSEMLSHRSRNYTSDQNAFLREIGTLIVDEAHLLTVPGRGDHLEVGLMKFTEINSKARIILLSATMPNVEEIASWISYGLTKRKTFVLNSTFRPVPLTTHYEIYSDKVKSYDIIEKEKVNNALEIVEYYTEDKFLIFSHTKKTGELMKNTLIKSGIKAEFHSADLAKSARISLENRFKNDKEPRVIVATSTLAWGCNLPARRVIVLGVNRANEKIASYDISQMVGRSGRLGIDPMGDAYVLIPESEQLECKAELQKPSKIESQLLNKTGPYYKNLAFHLVSEIHHGYVKNTEDVYRWYKRSLAYFQSNQLNEKSIDDTLTSLTKCGAIGSENDVWYARAIGKVASMFYYSPFDASDLFFNLKFIFDNQKQDDDYFVSMALANTDSARNNIVSRAEKDAMSAYRTKVLRNKTNKFITEGSCKVGFCYFNLMQGRNNPVFASFQRNIQLEFNRVSQVIQSLDTFGGKWGKISWMKEIEGKIVYGVPVHLINLCSIPNIGKVRATKLYEAGIKDAKSFSLCDKDKLKKLLNMKMELVEQEIKDSTVS